MRKLAFLHSSWVCCQQSLVEGCSKTGEGKLPAFLAAAWVAREALRLVEASGKEEFSGWRSEVSTAQSRHGPGDRHGCSSACSLYLILVRPFGTQAPILFMILPWSSWDHYFLPCGHVENSSISNSGGILRQLAHTSHPSTSQRCGFGLCLWPALKHLVFQ